MANKIKEALGIQLPCRHTLELSNDSLNTGAEYLVSLGEEIDEDWQEIDSKEVSEHTISEEQLNGLLELSVSGDSRKRSSHDTSLFKVRYKYAGNPNPQRGFCRTVMLANRSYRYEDLQAAESKVVNAGFGKGGSDKYSIWKYKGGVNCRHFWQRAIYLKKGNKKIGVNEARRMILDLEPEARDSAKWKQNEKEVAQVASASNNYWKATFKKNMEKTDLKEEERSKEELKVSNPKTAKQRLLNKVFEASEKK